MQNVLADWTPFAINVLLVTYPLIVSWGAWVTAELFMNRAHRTTAAKREQDAEGRLAAIESRIRRLSERTAKLRAEVKARE